MQPHIEAFLSRYRSLQQAKRIGIAVSGGADSVALLRSFAQLAPRHGWDLTVLHVNYGLRGEESDGDERFVRQLAGELGLTISVYAAKPEAADEDSLRRLRYDWFRSLALDAVLTGHTLEDQAETVLFRLLRGTGPQGLAGVLPQTEERVFRPFLAVSRQQIRDWLRENDWGWREDSSNVQLHYARNRIRRELLPLLESQWNPSLQSGLAQLAEVSRAEEAWLQPVVAQTVDALSHWEGKGLILEGLALNEAPLGLRRRLLREAIQRVKGNLQGITFAHIEAGMDLLAETEGNGRIQAAGVDLMRSFEWLRIIRLEDAGNLDDRNFRLALDLRQPLEIPQAAGTLYPALQKECQYNEGAMNLDWTRLSKAVGSAGRLEVRNWRPGDSYLRAASGKTEKLKDLFQIHRIPLWQRRSWPIVVLEDLPLWSRRFGPAAEWTAKEDTQEILRLEWRSS